MSPPVLTFVHRPPGPLRSRAIDGETGGGTPGNPGRPPPVQPPPPSHIRQSPCGLVTAPHRSRCGGRARSALERWAPGGRKHGQGLREGLREGPGQTQGAEPALGASERPQQNHGDAPPWDNRGVWPVPVRVSTEWTTQLCPVLGGTQLGVLEHPQTVLPQKVILNASEAQISEFLPH